MKQKKYINNKKTIIFSISTILFIALTAIILSNKIKTIDNIIKSFVIEIREDSLTNFMTIITNIGSAYSLIIISIILLIIIKRKQIPKIISINLLLVFLISHITKIIIRRPRPIGINLINATGYSFPSGHSMVSMAYFGFIAYLIYKYINNKILKVILISLIFIIVILIGFSRIYLGVHYFSDVIGGFLLSTTYLMVFIKLTAKYRGDN